MTKKIKIMTVAGTRPEFIKLSETIKLIDKIYDQILVNTNQNFEYELNKIFFKELNIRKPDYTFNTVDKKAISKIGDNFIKIEKIIKTEKPDAFLVLGDTNSGLVVYVAKRLKIPIFHIEAGNRCFDQRVPEEINRKVIDHLSDINLVYSDISRNYLIRENFPPQNIIKIGSPMMEIFIKNKAKINLSKILRKLKLKKGDYFLISFHREEHLDTEHKMSQFMKLLLYLDNNFKSKIIVSTHFKLRDRINKRNNLIKSDKIKLLKPFGFIDYSKLLINSRLVLSDSGTLNEEANVMGFHAVNLRETHERPEADEEAVTQLTGLDLNLISEIIKNKKNYTKTDLVKDYNVKNFSQKVAKIIGGYISKIQRDTWKKN